MGIAMRMRACKCVCVCVCVCGVVAHTWVVCPCNKNFVFQPER